MPRPGPRRPVLQVRVDQQHIDAIDQRAEREQVERSELLRRMLAYAQRHMPHAWRP